MGVAVLLLGTSIAVGWAAAPGPAQPGGRGLAGPDRIIAWNDLGMHCIDPDFSVFSILPPFNTINAQVVRNGQLVTGSAGVTVTYEAIADAGGSINRSSIGKTNFWDHVDELFGVTLPPDVGLAGNAMPGAANVPQDSEYHGAYEWFQAEGIPITPIDDGGAKQPYPLMKVTLRDGAGMELASTVTSVPVSQELLCSRCHASGSSPFARPAAGWVSHPDPLKDDRLNILRLHDEQHLGEALFDNALVTAGYSPLGLLDTVQSGGTSILCSTCHGSNALPGTGLPGISAMTVAMHEGHATVPTEDGTLLGDAPSRQACYTCHPGLDTQCLRGAMGKAVGHDGKNAMDCQSCHGGMAEVGDPMRVGWLEQQNCQNCHTGDALVNSGQIRFDSAFDGAGNPRTAASTRFATDPDVPAAGFSLYRFSTGHGELQCSACHGPPHAIYPTTVDNDNQQTALLQGHDGTLMECSVCHSGLEDRELDDGPHGMHSTDPRWVQDVHKDRAEQNLSACRACHGTTDRGTVLSETHTERTYNTPWGTKHFFSGQRITCYTCHDGPDEDHAPQNTPPSVPNVSVATALDVPLVIPFQGSDPNGDPLTYRIVDQPESGAFGRLSRGTVGFQNGVATFYPGEVQGAVTFTYCAFDGEVESNLGTVTVQVGAPACGGVASPYGFGRAGASGNEPVLSVSGCPEPGAAVTLEVSGGRPGTFAILVQGTEQATRELTPGAVLRVGGTGSLSSVLLDGNGAASVPFTVPAGQTAPIYLQLYVRDFDASVIGAFSNGLEIAPR